MLAQQPHPAIYLILIIDKIQILKIMRSLMPSKSPAPTDACTTQLQALGAQIRSQRKALRLSATVTAEAAGVSRVTLHRIEYTISSGHALNNNLVRALLADQATWEVVSFDDPAQLPGWGTVPRSRRCKRRSDRRRSCALFRLS